MPAPFGPNQLDGTFGPQVVFQRTPPAGQFNLPPSAGLQFFGQVDIDGASEVMTVRPKDLSGATCSPRSSSPSARADDEKRSLVFQARQDGDFAISKPVIPAARRCRPARRTIPGSDGEVALLVEVDRAQHGVELVFPQ